MWNRAIRAGKTVKTDKVTSKMAVEFKRAKYFRVLVFDRMRMEKPKQVVAFAVATALPMCREVSRRAGSPVRPLSWSL
jgi:hypothetical protein